MMEAVLEVGIPESWVMEISAKYGIPIRILDCVPFGDKGARSFVEMDFDDPVVMESVFADIKAHPDICKWEASVTEDGKVQGMALLTKCVACKAIMRSDCYLRSARTKGAGNVEWQVISGQEDALSTLITELKDSGCQVKLVSKKKMDDRSYVTRRQEAVIRTALEKGYYDYPRRTSLQDLARAFDVSPSTVIEILQRGERNMIREYFRLHI